jgi:hypothetical protein
LTVLVRSKFDPYISKVTLDIYSYFVRDTLFGSPLSGGLPNGESSSSAIAKEKDQASEFVACQV